MNRIKHLRKILGYTQEKLANTLKVSRSTVAMWETTSQSPDYETLKRISQLFNVPSDFVMSVGVFKDWDNVLKYYDSVSFQLRQMIPGDLEMPSFCGDYFVSAWLDTRLYFELDELQLARWFDFAIRDITIYPTTDGEFPTASVSVEFTSEFNALIAAHEKSEILPSNSIVSVRIPILGSIPAGIPIEAIETIEDWEELPAAMCTGGREYFALRVNGDSMWPDYLPGDIVIIRKDSVCESGDICAVYVNGFDATLKQVKLGENGSLSLIPRNPSYPPRTFTPEEITALPVSICGVVVELRRKIK